MISLLGQSIGSMSFGNEGGATGEAGGPSQFYVVLAFWFSDVD